MGKIILRLDRVMADRKVSLNDLSETVGVSNVNLSKMKNGRISAIRFSSSVALILPSSLNRLLRSAKSVTLRYMAPVST